MTNKQGKIWGETTEILSSPYISIHYLSIKKGGYCSEHYHENKFNYFFVISGKLEITIYRDHGHKKAKDITILDAGKETNIDPGFYHKFRALTNVECLEIYTPVELSEDIVRRSTGGLNEKK